MSKNLGFTMAEILLSLTIIGVVAAITLPSLMANINERTWNTQRKALYARMSQAIAMMPQVGGYGEYEGTNTDGSVTATKDTAAEAFLTEGLSKVLKINNICDAAHLADCGIATTYTDMAGVNNSWPTKLSELHSMFTGSSVGNFAGNPSYVFQNPQNNVDTSAAAFETQNGESVVLFYNPYCLDAFELRDSIDYAATKMCANFVYDLNGNKGPNTTGKDIGFISVLYSANPVVVAPMPLATDANSGATMLQTLASAACTAQDAESRMPNLEELASIFYNVNFIGGDLPTKGQVYWSGTLRNPELAWVIGMRIGHVSTYGRDVLSRNVRCVKR